MQEAIEHLPTLTNSNIEISNTKIPVSLELPNTLLGVVSAGKEDLGGSYQIKYIGVVYNFNSKAVEKYSGNINPTKIVDTLIGENL